MRNKHVDWHTYNYGSSIIAKSEINKRELHELAEEMFDVLFKHDIIFNILWIPEKNNELVDIFS